MIRIAHVTALIVFCGLAAGCASTPEEARTSTPAPMPARETAEPLVVAGQIDPTAPIPRDPGVLTGTLENGLSWYVRPNAKPEDRASLFMAVGAGSVDEDDDQLGLAHMVEHMAFNGTEEFPRQALIDYIESVGMAFGPDVNAFTSLDQTVYMLQVPTDDAELLDTGLRILENWAHRVSFVDEEIDKERGVIVEEWRSGLGAQDRIFDAQMPVVFHDSKYAERRTIGDMDIIQNHAYDSIKRYYRDWYRPDLQAVIAVGDFDPDAMIARIETLFGSIPPAAEPRTRENPPVPPHAETLYSVVTDPEATRTSVRIQWKHEPQAVTDIAAWRTSLIYQLGSDMLRQRFYEISQRPDPPFTMAFGGYRRQVRTMDAFSLMAFAQEDQAASAVEALVTEAERVRRHGFTEGELERARTKTLRSLESRVEEVDKSESRGWAFQYVSNFLYDQPIPGPAHQLQLARQLLPGVSVEEISAAITGLMPAENRVVTISGPEKDGLAWPSHADLAGILVAVQTADIAAYVDETVDAPLVAATPAPAAIVGSEHDPVLDTTTWTLANGVTVVVKPTTFKNDEVQMSSYAWGGTSGIADVDELERIGAAAGIVSNSGVGAFDEISLGKKLTGKMVSVGPGIGSLEAGFSGRCSPRDLETLCQLVYLYATEPREDPDGFAAYRSTMMTWFANRDADPMSAMRDTLQVRTSNRNPRSRPMTVEKLEKFDLGASIDFYREVFADCGDQTFFFVGNVDLAELEPLVRTWLGNLPAAGAKGRWTDRSWPLPTGVSSDTVARGIEPKGNVQLVFQGEGGWSADEEYALTSLASCLRIRLRQVVREEMSGTYGVRVGGSWQTIPRERYQLNVGWGCDPARIDELNEAVWSVIDEMAAAGPDAETLTKVRETQLRQHETMLQENRYWIGQLEKHHQRGTDPHGILSLPEQVETLNAEMIKAAASRYIDRDDYVRVVLVPEEATP